MDSILKKIFFLWTLFFTTLLFSDSVNIAIHITDVTANESDGTMTFTISLDQAPIFPISIDYNTIDGSAITGEDYVGTTDYLLFGLGISSRTFTIDILNDNIYEVTQSFYINLSTTASGYISTYDGTGTIVDDDPQALSISVFGKSITEIDSNNTISFRVQVNQNAPIGGLNIGYTTAIYTGSLADKALAGQDYITTTGTLTINEGVDVGYISVPIIGDLNPENIEKFVMKLTSTNQGTISVTGTEAIGTIYDDDTIQVHLNCTDTDEGNVGDNNKIPCHIFLDKALPTGQADILIDYQTSDGSTPSATVAIDYTSTFGSVTFTTGNLEHIIYIPIIGDNDIEEHENVNMMISGSSYIVPSTATVTAKILNDDGHYPLLSCDSSSVNIIEGDSGSTIFNYLLTLDAPALAGSSFEYKTEDDDEDDNDDDDGDGDPHDSDEDDDEDNDGDDDDDDDNDDEDGVKDDDYDPITISTYNIPEGESNISISVTINGDTKIEDDEIFYLSLLNPINIDISDCTNIKSTIVNDDGIYPNLSVTSDTFSTTEGDLGYKDLNFTFTLNQPALANSSFDYYTQNIEANSSDYLPIVRTTHLFSGGETNVTISVKIKGDSSIEPDEQFYLYIDNERDLTISGTQSPIGIIINDDLPRTIENIGEFRFDDCGAGEWKLDNSPLHNHAQDSNISIITNDAKSYMCTSLNGYNHTVQITHHSAYEITEGTFSILLYDHHNVSNSNSWLFQKGDFKIKVVRVANDLHKGSVDIYLDGLKIRTQEVYFTNSNGGDSDSQWIHVAVTFGLNGLKLYINGIEKGSNSYTGGIALNENNVTMATLSGYFDELYIFKGQMIQEEIQEVYNKIINNKNLDGTLRDCSCGNPNIPLTCDSSIYLSSSIKRGTGETGKMWLHKINTQTNPFTFDVVDDIGEIKTYNALAYSDSGDSNSTDFIFGLYHDQLIKIGTSGKAINLGVIPALSPLLNNHQFFAGTAYNGYYYISGPGVAYNKIFKIKLSDKTVTEIILDTAISLLDFSFTPDGQFLHGIIDGGKLVKINVNSGAVTFIGSAHTGYQFDSTFSDKNGRFFANDSFGNGFFEFDLLTGDKLFLSDSQPATFNDGANCLKEGLLFTDYGDAPDTYKTPRHIIANGIFMGTKVDHDIHPYHNVDAFGDDSNGTDDEDGVTLLDGSDLNGSYFPIDTIQELNITVSKDGYLNAWLDYNINGSFNNGNEKIISALPLTAGTHKITFPIPLSVTTNQMTYIRFRYSSQANLNFQQSATDGEVEDYAVFFGSAVQPLRGTFNIERINSGTDIINTSERNAWYTQIVGRDFHYSVVFYDENITSTQDTQDLTFKITLYNNETNMTISEMTPFYGHFSALNPSHRISITDPNDLNQLSAYKNVTFHISYAINADQSIVQEPCPLGDYEACYNALSSIYTIKTSPAKDNFAIRPKLFLMNIEDLGIERVNNDVPHSERLASGYNYHLNILAMDNNNLNVTQKYNSHSVTQSLIFMGNKIDCRNITDDNRSVIFNNGINIDNNFSHNEVGIYILTLLDKLWTYEDWKNNKGDCIENNATVSSHGYNRSGCNITSKNDLTLNYYPHHFHVNMAMNVLPNSGHNEFIYMSEINSSNNGFALQFTGTITAQSENNTSTKNFTVGCASENVDLSLNANIQSDRGINQPLLTTANNQGIEANVFFRRLVNYNNTIFTDDGLIPNIQAPFTISKNRFLDPEEGRLALDLRYNIDKNITQTINPVSINATSLNIEASDAHSKAEGSLHYIPRGTTALTGRHFFYYSQVAPDTVIYPRVNFMGDTVEVSTPLSVEIFCKHINGNFCNTMNIFNHTNIYSSASQQEGWYISTQHNQNLDGKVMQLIPNTTSITVQPNSNISFQNGINNTITTTVQNGINSTNKVLVVVPKQLKYNKDLTKNGNPEFEIPVIPQTPSEWAGIGEAGNIIDTKAHLKTRGKVDW